MSGARHTVRDLHSRFGPRRPGRAALGTGVLIAFLLVGPAAAHVAVSPDSAPAGASPAFSFRVPNERPVPTTSVRIVIPDSAPIATARPEPKAGWKTSVERTALTEPATVDGTEITRVVRSVTWDGGTIAVGDDERFVVTLGPLPGPGTIAFRAVQTYADGEIVRWNQPAVPGGAEPERPAPTLTVTPDPTPATTAPTTTAAPVPTAASTTTIAAPSDRGSAGNAGRFVAAVAGVALLVAATARVLRRRRTDRS